MIPDHQTLMRPLLECIQDGQEHIFKNIVVKLADRFELSPEEREQLQPSGRYPLFSGRVGWAKNYMKKAGLLEQKKRGYLSITPLGTTALKSEERIDTAYLTRYPAFVRFQAGAPHNEKTENAQPVPAIDAGCTSAVTPEETIAHAYEQIHNKLSSELLDAVLMQDFAFFERLVVELLVKMGYGGSIKDAGRAIGRTGDEGIDGIIKEDKLGLDVIHVQAKKWSRNNTVGRPELHKFVGALAGQGSTKGIFITTSSFTKEAESYKPQGVKLVKIDGEKLAQLMIEHNLGVATALSYEIKRIDRDYFNDLDD